MLKQIILLSLAFQLFQNALSAQARQNKIAVIAYYAGDSKSIDSNAIKKLTHIIFSFCHLKGNRLAVDDDRDAKP